MSLSLQKLVCFVCLHGFWGVISEQSIEFLQRKANQYETRFASVGDRQKILNRLIEESYIRNCLFDTQAGKQKERKERKDNPVQQLFNKTHSACRNTEEAYRDTSGENEIKRIKVTDEQVNWLSRYDDYNPVDYTAKSVLLEEGKKSPQHGLIHKMQTPKSLGRTGLRGRGILGKWGPNHAADTIVSRRTKDGRLEMVMIRKRKGGDWAMPGGMVDNGETPEDADGSGITDNAWMETTVYNYHDEHNIMKDIRLEGGDDAGDAQWVTVDEEMFKNRKIMTAHHNF
uniref:Nudix hydrolase domain-containing protein n=1 Tax=Ditylenchus dipsaci TaxID=166011 RepID=A0A915CSG1_9BILA